MDEITALIPPDGLREFQKTSESIPEEWHAKIDVSAHYGKFPRNSPFTKQNN